MDRCVCATIKQKEVFYGKFSNNGKSFFKE